MNDSEKTVQVVATPDGAPTEIAVQAVELPAPSDGQVQVQIRAARHHEHGHG